MFGRADVEKARMRTDRLSNNSNIYGKKQGGEGDNRGFQSENYRRKTFDEEHSFPNVVTNKHFKRLDVVESKKKKEKDGKLQIKPEASDTPGRKRKISKNYSNLKK